MALLLVLYALINDTSLCLVAVAVSLQVAKGSVNLDQGSYG